MSDAKVVKLTINGKAVEVSPQTTVFQAAQKLGIFIPHYCYHPDLSIAGVCRMCMVDVEKNPKLQISCNTQATEGMVVNTETDKVKEAVKGILELHLINHPLDCPICDKAGECKLQDYYTVHGLYESRIEMEDKVHKPKVQDIGTIVLDSERCILCTRCVRFTAEVTKTHELGIFNRGNRSTLLTADGGPLRNDYTGNLADICPVGALTAKDFRFKQRVWFLDKIETVCTQCARGCNTTVSVNTGTQKLFRVEPRRNPDVNASWICDKGRWDYHYTKNETRIKNPQKKTGTALVEETWHVFFQEMSQKVKSSPDKTIVGLSTQLTNEELIDAVEAFEAMGIKKFVRLVNDKFAEDTKPYDGILKHHDLTANALGFTQVMEKLGVKYLKMNEAQSELSNYENVILLGLEGIELPGVAEFILKIPKTSFLVLHATNFVSLFEKAAWIIPNVTSYEKSGSVVNALGRLQKLVAALPWQYLSRDLHALVFGVKNGGDREVSPSTRAQTVFRNTLTEKIFPGVRQDWRRLGATGVNIGEVGYREGRINAKT